MSKPSYSIVTGSTTAADGLSLDSYLARRDRWQSGAAGTPPPVRLAARDLGKARTITSCKKTLAKLSSESSILFATASAELAESSSKTLDELVKLIKACGDVVIRVEGHTDSIGKAENNLELSKARAKSVLEYLAKAGIDRSHLEAIGYGETKPIASNASNKTRALNRRIEFSVR